MYGLKGGGQAWGGTFTARYLLGGSSFSGTNLITRELYNLKITIVCLLIEE